MKRKYRTCRFIVVAALFMMIGNIQKAPAEITQNEEQTAGDNWLVFVPPSGVEKDLPAYDQWPQVFEKGHGSEYPAMIKKAATPAWLILFGLLRDGSNLTAFQSNHVIFYDPQTKEVEKASWGWK